MSEIINVTVIIENENEKNEDGIRKEIEVSHDINVTLMSTLLKENVISGDFCGGRGSCKRCRIQFLNEAPIPTEIERGAFTPDELRKGYRLACMARPKKNCVIRPDLIAPRKIEILTAENIDFSGITEENEIAKANKSGGNGYIIAVDLGTTTIAMQLMEMNSGKVIDTYCVMNPQRSYGTDVLSRIHAANNGNAQNLKNIVWNVIHDGVDSFSNTIEQGRQRQQLGINNSECSGQFTAEEQESGEICCMCIAGNTTMEHLLMGLSTEKLGRSPFTPVEIGLQKCTLPFQCADKNLALQVYITPGIGAFVGGDIAAGLYHCGLLDISEVKNMKSEDEAVLFIDLGTNGEMAITDGSSMLVTAASAGPAFEGGANAAVPGSDMIAITASLLKQGIIDETGLLAEEYFEQGIDVPLQNLKKPVETTIHLTQKDIRDLQMAKAAVRAGIEILYEKMGCPGLAHVYLAGGFGYYLDVNAAIAIGLLPERMQHIVTAPGNTSLAGAFEMGRDLWTGRLNEETLSKKLQRVESINLAQQENFEALYLKYLNFPMIEA